MKQVYIKDWKWLTEPVFMAGQVAGFEVTLRSLHDEPFIGTLLPSPSYMEGLHSYMHYRFNEPYQTSTFQHVMIIPGIDRFSQVVTEGSVAFFNVSDGYEKRYRYMRDYPAELRDKLYYKVKPNPAFLNPPTEVAPQPNWEGLRSYPVPISESGIHFESIELPMLSTSEIRQGQAKVYLVSPKEYWKHGRLLGAWAAHPHVMAVMNIKSDEDTVYEYQIEVGGAYYTVTLTKDDDSGIYTIPLTFYPKAYPVGNHPITAILSFNSSQEHKKYWSCMHHRSRTWTTCIGYVTVEPKPITKIVWKCPWGKDVFPQHMPEDAESIILKNVKVPSCVNGIYHASREIDTWEMFLPNVPQWTNLKELLPGEDYWLSVKEPVDWELR